MKDLQKIMLFKNFSLQSPTQEIEILLGDLRFDLHNFARLRSFGYNSHHSAFTLEWRPLDKNDPWGSLHNTSSVCQLSFEGIKALRITQDPDRLVTDESLCLHGLSMVDQTEKNYRFRSDWKTGDPFNLLIQFVSGWEIEIDSASAEWVLLK